MIKKLAGLLCLFSAFVLVVLAFALPVYKTSPELKDYNGKDPVIAGTDGYLFSAYTDKTNALSDFKGENLFSEKELESRVSALADTAKQLSDKGCVSVFVFVPSKAAVYRDKLPDNAAKLYSKTRRFTQLYEAVSGAGLDALDVFSYFDGIKDKEQLYDTAADTLNEAGGYRLFEQTAKHINEKYKINVSIPDISGYETEITEDAAYPLTREYRNVTGLTVPNRTVTLKEKTVLYKDAGYDYHAVSATEIPKENRADGVYYPVVAVFDTGASESCRKFFSASSALAVFRTGFNVDETVVDRAKPGIAVFMINENEIPYLPVKRPDVVSDGSVSAEPVIKATAYSDADRFVIFGTAEPRSWITVKGGAEETGVYTEDGEFTVEVPILTDQESSVVSVQSKTDGKEESGAVTLNVRYTDMNGYKNVVIGKDGHLHYQETVPDFTGETALTDETVSQYVGYLSAKADAIHKVSPETKIIYVIPPNHLTVYPETAPDDLAERQSETTRLTQLIEAFKDNEKVIFIDLRTALIEAKKTAPYRLYNKTDTHWNELGAYYAYREIMNVISRDYPDAAPDPLDGFDVFIKTVPGGDMANFLEVDLDDVTEEGVYVRSKSGLKSGINKDYSMNFANAWFSDQHEFKIDGGNLPTMIMYRDSFSTNLMSFMAEKFSRSVFHTMWEYPDEYELYAQMQPDYIIIERVERSLGGL